MEKVAKYFSYYFSDVICSLHFDQGSFIETSYEEDNMVYVSKKLKEKAIPTLYLPKTTEDTTVIVSSTTKKQIQHYNEIENRTQIEDMKNVNKKLQKAIEITTKELAALTRKYQKSLNQNHIIKKELKQYTNLLFTDKKIKQIFSKIFSSSQIKILMGKKKASWSDHDMAMGYTIKYLSNYACYNYLVKNMNFPLPGWSTLGDWIRTKSGSGFKKN